MEKDPAEHLHPLDQRASQVREQAGGQLAARPGRRPAAHRPAGDPQPQEDVQQVPQQAHRQPDEAGERDRGAGLPGEGENKAGVHR